MDRTFTKKALDELLKSTENYKLNKPESPLSDDAYANALAEMSAPLKSADINLPVIDSSKPNMGIPTNEQESQRQLDLLRNIRPPTTRETIPPVTPPFVPTEPKKDTPSLLDTLVSNKGLKSSLGLAGDLIKSAGKGLNKPEDQELPQTKNELAETNKVSDEDIAIDEQAIRLNEALDKYRNAGDLRDNVMDAALARNAQRQSDLDWLDMGSKFAAGFTDTKNLGITDTLRNTSTRNLETVKAQEEAAKAKKQELKDAVKFEQDLEKFQMDKKKFGKDMNQMDLSAKRLEQEIQSKDLDMQNAEKMKDPNSEESKALRKFYREQGFNVGETIPASVLADKFGALSNLAMQRLNIQEAAKNRALQKEEMALRKEERAAEKEQAKAQKERGFVQGLRKEATSGEYGKLYNNYRLAERTKNMLEEFAKNPTGYSDYASLMTSLKSLQGDSSVVRETEIRLGMEAGSLKTKMANYVEKLKTGKMLQPEQRQQMIDAVNILSTASKRDYVDAIKPLMTQAEEEGINPNLIIGSELQRQEQQKTIVKKQYSKSANKTKLIYSDGTEEIVDGQK